MSASTNCKLIGSIHTLPLPGSSEYGGSVREIIARAVDEAKILQDSGFDGAILQNFHDRPYVIGSVGAETVAAMAAIAQAVRAAAQDGFYLGVQILAGADREALGVAVAADLDFIRMVSFLLAPGPGGVQARGRQGEIVRLRRYIQAERIKLWVDLRKSFYGHLISEKLDQVELARELEFYRADGIVVSGRRPSETPYIEDVMEVRGSTHLPIIIGSGVTPEKLPAFYPYAHAIILGKALKRDGRYANPVDAECCRNLVRARPRA